jgi:hypothetical protein
MAKLKGGKLTDAEKATIQQFAETGGLDVMPTVAKTLNRSEKVIMGYVETLDNVKQPEEKVVQAPTPPPQLSNKPQAPMVNGVHKPATNKDLGVSVMTRAASEHSDSTRQTAPPQRQSHIVPCKQEDRPAEVPSPVEAEIAALTAQLEALKDAAANAN